MRSWVSVLATCMITLSAGAAEAQLVKQFDRTFGGAQDDELVSVVAAPGGGYYLAGYSMSGVSGDKSEPLRGGWDFWVVKLDAGGNKLWDRTLGSTYTVPQGQGWIGEWLHDAALTQDGGVILVGTSWAGIDADHSEPGRGEGDYWVVRLDAGGNKVWDRTIGGPGFDWADGVVATSDGGFLVVGSGGLGTGGEKTEPSFGGWSGHDYWVVKLDGAGNELWDHVFGGGNWDSPHAGAVELVGGGYVIAGTSTSPAGGNKTAPSYVPYQDGDLWVVGLDPAGNKLWDKAYGGTAWDDGTRIVATADGGFAFLGVSSSGISGDKTEAGRGGTDLWLVKADAGGNKTWDRTYGSPGNDWGGTGLVQTPDGGFLLAGASSSGAGADKSERSRGADDAWLVRADSAGNVLWDKTVGGGAEDDSPVLVLTPDGGYALGMVSRSGISPEKTEASRGGSDYWLVKLGDLSVMGPTVTGIAYLDLNNNCSYDPGVDAPIANRVVQADAGPYFTSTDETGRYTLRVPDGGYTIQQAPVPNDPYGQTCPSPSATFAVQAMSNVLAAAGNFGNASLLLASGLTVSFSGVYPYPLTSPCPGQTNTECVTYQNGSTPSAVMGYYVSIFGNTAGATIVGGVTTSAGCACSPLTVSTVDIDCPTSAPLGPGGFCQICFDVSVPSTAGPTDTVGILAMDYDGNFETFDDPVICSMDPNDLVLLRPASCGPAAFVPNGTPLVYRLRFQNTGNGPAHNVVLQDVLDPTVFDAATFKLLGSTYPVTRTEIFPGNQLMLSFIGIELPPESQDPLGSIGTVVFSVEPKAGLVGPVQATNSAAIYFDLNKPVITNETTHTLVDDLPPVTLAPQSKVCLEDPPFSLSGGQPSGGTYSGNGVTGDVFDPAAAGAGAHRITYTHTATITDTNYSVNQVGTFAPIPGSGAGLSLADDQVSAPLPIGFTFNFYGNDYTSFYISSNGFITFNAGSANGCCSGAHLPNGSASLSNLIAFAWDDLYPPGAGTIEYFTTGTAPNRVLAVNFNGVARCCNGTPAVSTQVLLYEGTNVIEIHTTSTTSNNGMTMGVEDDTGTFATAVPGRNGAAFSIANDFVQLNPPASAQFCSDSASRTIVVRSCDPVCVTISRGLSGDVADALISTDSGTDGSADRNYGGSNSLTAGGMAARQIQALLRFDLGPIPKGATIVSATATLHTLLYPGTPVTAHLIAAPWSEPTVTWASFAGAFSPAAAATFPGTSAPSADLTALVQAWVDGSVPNHGILLERDLTSFTVFASSEYQASTRPSLDVCYLLP